MPSAYEEINTRISLPEYMEHCGVDVKQNGDGFKCLCFKHADTEPSMSIKQVEGKWQFYCHGAGCNIRGDVIDFHKQYYDVVDIDAIKALSEYAGIPIPDKRPGTGRSVSTGRKIVQEYLVENLKHDENAMNRLKGRGVTPETAEKWGIGITGTNMYDYFKKVFEKDFKGSDDLLLFMVKVGIARKGKARVEPSGWFREGRYTIPFMHKGDISHWFFRDIEGSSGGSQCPNEIRDEDCQWFNQRRIGEESLCICEGPWDCIALEEYGHKAMAMAGYSKKKIEMIQATFVPNEAFDELTKRQKINIIFDRDENRSGQNMAIKTAEMLSPYCDCKIYKLPVGKDIDTYLYAGGKLDALESHDFKPQESRVVVQNGHYWIKTDDKLREIGNFIIKRKYQFRNSEGVSSYDASVIRKDGLQSHIAVIGSRQWANPTDFRMWLYDFGMDLVYEGALDELGEIIKYLSVHEVPRQIFVHDAYGDVGDGMWLADNGAIVSGEVIWADDDGIIQLQDNEAIKTTLENNNDIVLIDESEAYTPDEIVKSLLKYYGRDFTLRMLGFVTASYYQTTIQTDFKQFPIGCCYGKTGKGKTKMADVISSLLGGGVRTSFTKDSTAKGVARALSSIRSIPIVINEFDESRLESLIRSVFDRDQTITARRSIGDETFMRNSNTTIILTNENVPKSPSIVNRMVLFDFYKFDQKISLMHEFDEFYRDGVMQHRNIGWLYALSKTDGKKTILDDIWYSMETLQQMAEDEKRVVSAREIENNAVVFGALRTAFRALNLNQFSITPEEIMHTFINAFDDSRLLCSEEEPLKIFFEVFERIVLENKGGSYYWKGLESRMTDDSIPGREVIQFKLRHVFELVKQEEKKASDRLRAISARDIASAIHIKFKIEQRAHGHVGWGFKIPVDDLRREYGVSFECVNVDTADAGKE